MHGAACSTLEDEVLEAHEELLQAKLEALVSRFRVAVEQVVAAKDVPSDIQHFPRGCCAIVSELMGDFEYAGHWGLSLCLLDERRCFTRLA